MKGIILAGGAGTRLYPATMAVSKQILPVYDKPMIYYPLSVLMLAGIREVLIISTPRDIGAFQDLFGDGAQLGMRFEYAVQPVPRGLADAFIIGEKFIGNERVALILGDNIFYGQGLSGVLKKAVRNGDCATIFGLLARDPARFGVVEFDEAGNVVSIEEKPRRPKSNYIVPGLYFYTSDVVDIAKNVQPSGRGEIEITAVNNEYLRRGKLQVKILGRGMAWLDTGTHESLMDASNFVAAIQNTQGVYVACIEEIAFKQGFMDAEMLKKRADSLGDTAYAGYIRQLLRDAEQGSAPDRP
jgi:glucose-1-phosphate thymidylyltransferase